MDAEESNESWSLRWMVGGHFGVVERLFAQSIMHLSSNDSSVLFIVN